eukprot:GILI01007811.1.p1 GENE.GILI01007811.1~~GILI01007811.1.p1  ORF type:complete len:670 (-),score=211.37 GILI01007811.1:129-2138(-)
MASKINVGVPQKNLLEKLLASSPKSKTAVGFALVIAALIYVKSTKGRGRSRDNASQASSEAGAKKGGKGRVDGEFIRRIKVLLKIAVPGVKSREFLLLLLLSAFLVVRTFLSIYLAAVNGGVVKAIVDRDFKSFVSRIGFLALFSMPASYVNSYLDYLQKVLAIRFRRRLTDYFHESYLKDMCFYQLSNLDSRISNPDQRLTQDIDKWAQSLASLYANFTKPLLDIVLFSRKLAELVGLGGPLAVILWYFVSGIIIRVVSPPFGKLTAEEQRLEGDYRGCHNDLLSHAEEIAFYRGSDWEKNRINSSFNSLVRHINRVLDKRLFMGCFDSMLVKYGAVMVGYAVVGLPVFGPGRQEYLARIGSDPAVITRDYVRNSSLLINLAKAIGRIVVSYKEVQSLAGFTSLVYEFKEVLEDLKKGTYKRTQVTDAKVSFQDRGELVRSDRIEFKDVPIVSPNGDILIEKLCFTVNPGMNLMIAGPNGCGKSSMFRILGELWPVFGGTIFKPDPADIFYIPQRPYLPNGTLRDQVIYPHSVGQMKARGITDESLLKLLEVVHLSYLVDREGGWDKCNAWNDVLSGGEKQRIAMARLFYHQPKFAILDECTSAVSMDVEGIMYSYCKQIGITLLTVSHRPSLWKYHEYILRFDGAGNYKFEPLSHDEVPSLPPPAKK